MAFFSEGVLQNLSVVMAVSEIEKDIRTWARFVEDEKRSDRGVTRADAVDRLNKIAVTSGDLRSIIRDGDIGSEAYSWLVGAGVGRGLDINLSVKSIEESLRYLEHLEVVANTAAENARLGRGEKDKNAWDSSAHKEMALCELIVLWRDWTERDKLDAPFPYLAQNFMALAFGTAGRDNPDYFPDFDRLLKSARARVNAAPGNFRVARELDDWGNK